MQRLTKRNIKVINHDTGQQIDFPTFGKEAGEDAYNQVSNQLTSLQSQLESSIVSMSEAIVTDKTLTIEDAPADAKATGDAINNLRGAVGSPLVAATAAAMTDTNKVYIYTGSETGYTNGNWYYHDGTSWVSGGVYNSVAVDLDSTLTLANKAPDSKVVGDAIGSLNEDITNLNEQINGGTTPATVTLPEPYKGAAYSNAAGTLKYKYEDNKLVLSKSNGTKGEININNASLTLDANLAYVVNGTEQVKLSLSYNNANAEDIVVLQFRFYTATMSQYSLASPYIPVGEGSMKIDLVELATDKGIDLSTRFNVIIYGITLLEGAESYSTAVLQIDGFEIGGSSSEGLVDQVNSLDYKIARKLNAPATHGASGQVLTSDGNGGQSWQTPDSGTVDYTDLNNKPQINSVTLSGSKSLSDLGIASASALSELDEQINGIEPTIVYTLPQGYQNAVYSNAAGTLLYKYEDGELVLSKSNGTKGEINNTNSSLTIDSTLMYEVDPTESPKISYTYENANDAGIAVLGLRYYDSSISNFTAAGIYIPVGEGTDEVDLVALAESKSINLASRNKVMIRSIALLENSGGTYSIAIVRIKGFGVSETSGSGLVEQIDSLEDEVHTISESTNALSGKIDSAQISENFYEKRYEDLGYPDTSTGSLYLYNAARVEKTSKYIPVTPGEKWMMQAWASDDPHGRIAYYASDKTYISYEDIPSANRTQLEDGTYKGYLQITVPQNASFIRFGYYSFCEGNASITKPWLCTDWFPALCDVGSHVYNIADDYPVVGVAHMGKKNLAPENTRKSFIFAASQNYKFVETDVRCTADDIPVLLHDATINRVARNADGTTLASDVYIKDITYDEALEYDFGIAFNQSYAGTKIMSFEEFIVLCKRLKLGAHIEIKNDENDFTQAQVNNLVDIVNRYSMNHMCTWQSYNLKVLKWVKQYCPESRLMMSTHTQKGMIELRYFLKTAFNETIACADEQSEYIALAKEYGIPLYTFATQAEYAGIDEYITGIISDDANYDAWVQEQILNEIT